MKQKKIAAMLLITAMLTAGCSELTLGGVAEPAASGSSIPAATGSSVAAAPAAATATDQASAPQDKPKTEADLTVEEWAGRIYPGISISGFKVGGMTHEEAAAKLQAGHEGALERILTFTADGEKFSISQRDLGAAFDYQAALEEAKTYYSALPAEEQVNIIKEAPALDLSAALTVDEAKLEAFTEKVSQAIQQELTPLHYGVALKKDEFKAKVREQLLFSLKPAQTVKSPVEVTSLELNEEDQTTIAKASTYFYTGNKTRTFNVKRGTAKINGTVIQPGEVFSFNAVVGAASKKNGFKAATVYAGDGMEEGYGGGICQVSSTLYNAIVRAGLPLVERHTHGYIINYLPKGMDATIFYPSLDLKFRNTFAYPITIRGSAKDGTLTFRFLSHKDAMGGVTYKFSQKLLWEGETHWRTTYTTSLAPGKTKIEYYPLPASSVNVYRSTYQDGKRIKREKFDKVTYRELKGKKKVGKK